MRSNEIKQNEMNRYIQSFGCIIGINSNTSEIEFFSENINQFFVNQEQPILGKHVLTFFDFEINYIQLKNLEVGHIYRKIILINEENHHLTIHQNEGILILEIEKQIQSQDNDLTYLDSVQRIIDSQTELECWDVLIKTIKGILDFDRVIVYEYIGKTNGLVTHEVINEGLISYLGTTFDISLDEKVEDDIFKYVKSKYIENTDGEKIKIINKSEKLYDLRYAITYRFTDVYLQYLRTADIKTCLILSFSYNGKYKMIVCHSYTHKRISYKARLECENLLTLAKVAYLKSRNEGLISDKDYYRNLSILIKENLLIHSNFFEALKVSVPEINKITNSIGIAVINNEDFLTYGNVASLEEITRIKDWATNNLEEILFYSNSFKKDYGKLLKLSNNTIGVMFGFLNEEKTSFIIWFKGSVDKTIFRQELLTKEETKNYSFRENMVNNISEEWQDDELAYALEIIKLVKETFLIKESKIQNLHKEVDNLNDEMDIFSSTISHDLRTPLSVMKLNCQMLERSLGEDIEKIDKIKSVILEIDKVTEMMTDILEHNKAKKIDIILNKVNIQPIINKIVEDVKLRYNAINTKVYIDELPSVMADNTMLYEVFVNIIGNAIKYSLKKEKPEVHITSEVDDDKIIINIKDNGIGIKTEDNEKMFKLFSRMSNTGTITGNGVGLAITARMMNRMKGEIAYKSNDEDGTIFSLTFKKS